MCKKAEDYRLFRLQESVTQLNPPFLKLTREDIDAASKREKQGENVLSPPVSLEDFSKKDLARVGIDTINSMLEVIEMIRSSGKLSLKKAEQFDLLLKFNKTLIEALFLLRKKCKDDTLIYNLWNKAQWYSYTFKELSNMWLIPKKTKTGLLYNLEHELREIRESLIPYLLWF